MKVFFNNCGDTALSMLAVDVYVKKQGWGTHEQLEDQKKTVK